jgi:phenylacetaldehyde dehydrogenase
MNAPFFQTQLERLNAGFLARTHKLFIDNQWVDAASGETFDVHDPSTGKKIATVAAGDAADVDAAVKAARRAFESGPWPKMSADARARLIHKLADAIEENADELATLESLDGGNPINATRHFDIASSVEFLHHFAGWTDKIFGDVPTSGFTTDQLGFTFREPIGVVGAITPWNAPLILTIFKLGPALATGCTIVHKPAELAPLTALRLAELAAEVGLPPGVLNVVTGMGPTAGQSLVDHAGVDKIAFTGSTATGKLILQRGAATMKRVTLELGGKSPVVIFADADIDAAIAAVSGGIFFKTGQFCAAGARIMIHKKVYDRVVQGFTALAEKVRIGKPLSFETDMGPIISQKQLDRVTGYLAAGVSDGAEVVTGGKTLGDEGYFIQPTLLANVRSDMSVFRDEIFGPVICAIPFGDESLDEIAAIANDTTYGLAARVWTRDLRTAMALSRTIKAGTIEVNGGGGGTMPFGGYKQSGLGRELGREGVEAYTELKTVRMRF